MHLQVLPLCLLPVPGYWQLFVSQQVSLALAALTRYYRNPSKVLASPAVPECAQLLAWLLVSSALQAQTNYHYHLTVTPSHSLSLPGCAQLFAWLLVSSALQAQTNYRYHLTVLPSHSLSLPACAQLLAWLLVASALQAQTNYHYHLTVLPW